MTAELIEDGDGAPLPPELQRDSAAYAAVVDGIERMVVCSGGADRADLADEIVRGVAPVLWPWLPQNDHGAPARLAAVLRVHRRSVHRANCVHDFEKWPCETARAAGVTEEAGQ